MSETFTVSETTGPQRAWLRALAEGGACPADVAMLLTEIADGRDVTGHDVRLIASRDQERANNFYARLRASGLDIPRDVPDAPVTLVAVRDQLLASARVYVSAMDKAAAAVARARAPYLRELGG